MRKTVVDALVDVGVVGYLFALGACVGSFANVVVYRWPRGLSILRPGSRCDFCHTRIAGYDNIPIFSWVHLRGRCRHCGTPLSARYPIVEAIFGLLFVAVLAGMLASVTRVASTAAEWPRGADLIDLLLRGRGQAIGWYLRQVVVASYLLTGAIVHFDGRRIPPRLTISATAIVAVLLVARSESRLVALPAAPERAAALGISWRIATVAIRAAVGLAAMAIVARIATAIAARRSEAVRVASTGLMSDAGDAVLVCIVAWGVGSTVELAFFASIVCVAASVLSGKGRRIEWFSALLFTMLAGPAIGFWCP